MIHTFSSVLIFLRLIFLEKESAVRSNNRKILLPSPANRTAGMNMKRGTINKNEEWICNLRFGALFARGFSA